MLFQILSLILVAALWGCTNPFLKKNTRGITKIKADNVLTRFILEIKYLLTNYSYLTPMALNQLGSVLFFITLQNTELSLSVPVANSLTFVFTAITGWFIGESLPSRNTLLGMFLILAGISLCCYDKYLNQIQTVGVR